MEATTRMGEKYYFKAYELLKKINPEEMGLEFTSIQRIELKNNTMSFETADEEVCLSLIDGEINYSCNEVKGSAIFRDMLYVPIKTSITISSSYGAVLMRFGAPSSIQYKLVHIRFSDVDKDEKRHKVYGKKESNCRRDVWNYIDENFNSSRYLIGICQGDIGGWTAWPPHEHAKKREEVYVYFNMGNSFGLQCVYKDIGKQVIVALVENGDMVSIPRGYHPNVGCPAGRISYIYCMVSKKEGDRRFMDLDIQKQFGNKFE